MTRHPYWQSPAVEQRRDPKESWDDLGQFLDHLVDFKRRLAGGKVLLAEPSI